MKKMRKLNQVVRPRPVPCPIPRPPTPPHSVHVEHLKSQLLNSNKHSLVSSHSSNVIMKSSSSSSSTSNNPFKDIKITSSSREASQTIVDVHSLPSDDDGSSNISTSSNSSVETGIAVEPNEDFPPPPEEFLEDIRAVRKQEEIEGPIPSPTVTNQRMLHVFDLTSDHFTQSNLSQRQRSSLCYNGNGSLNSSITEATESASSWSPSVSPVPSPLPSPSHSSLDSTSTPNFIIGNNQLRSVLHESAFPSSPSSTSSCFQFPPPTSSHLIRHTTTNSRIETNQLINSPQVHHLHPRRTSKGIVIALTGVTLAPLSTSCEKESIYQKLPAQRASNPPASSVYGTLPRSGSGSGANTGGMKPPDYNTAMQRLSLAKNISMNANAVKVSQQSGMKQGALVGGQQPQVHRRQLIAAVNPQIQVQQREQSLSHQQEKLIHGSSSPTISTSSHTTSSPPTPIHKSFSSCSDSGLTSSGNGDSSSTAPAVRGSQSQATQKDNHQNRQEIQSPPSCLKSTQSQASPSHDSNHGSLSQSSRRRNLPHLPETSAPSPTCSISSSSTHNKGNNCIKSKDSPSKGKKRVSFSDQVELVGLEEEYLPNPLLERILGKAFLANNNISN